MRGSPFWPLRNTSATLPRKLARPRPDSWTDVLFLARSTGLACAIRGRKIGLKAVVLDKGCVVNSVYNYPDQHGVLYDP